MKTYLLTVTTQSTPERAPLKGIKAYMFFTDKEKTGIWSDSSTDDGRIQWEVKLEENEASEIYLELYAGKTLLKGTRGYKYDLNKKNEWKLFIASHKLPVGVEKDPSRKTRFKDVLNSNFRNQIINSLALNGNQEVLQELQNYNYEDFLQEEDKLSNICQRIKEDILTKKPYWKVLFENTSNSTPAQEGDPSLKEFLQLDQPVKDNSYLKFENQKLDLLSLAQLSKIDKKKINTIEAYAYVLEGSAKEDWDKLKEKTDISEAELSQFRLNVNIFRLTDQNLELTKFISRRKEINTVHDLVKLRTPVFTKWLHDLDDIPNEVDDEVYIENIENRIERSFPTAYALDRMVTLDISFGKEDQALRNAFGDIIPENEKNIQTYWKSDRNPVKKFYEVHPTLDIRSIDLLSEEENTIDWNALDAKEIASPFRRYMLKFQRILTLSPNYKTTEAFMAKGYYSASQISRLPLVELRKQIKNFKEDDLRFIKNQADREAAKVSNLKVIAHNLRMNRHYGLHVDNTISHYEGANKELADLLDDELKKFPAYEELFGPQNFCTCSHCQSIFGPAAYFVDLMQYIKYGVQFKGQDRNNENHALRLQRRRPDLWDIKLSCENSVKMVPTLEVINEILTQYIRESLQKRGADILEELSKANLSFHQPFHLPLEELKLLSEHFKLSRLKILKLFNPGFDKTFANIFLGLSDEKRLSLTQSDNISFFRFGKYFGSGLANNNGQDFKSITYKLDKIIKASGINRAKFTQISNSQNLLKAPAYFEILKIEDSENIQKFSELIKVDVNEDKLDKNEEEIESLALYSIYNIIALQNYIPWTIREIDAIYGEIKEVLFLVQDRDYGDYSNMHIPLSNLREYLEFVKLNYIQEVLDISVEELIGIYTKIPQESIRSQTVKAPYTDYEYEVDIPSLMDRLFNPEEIRIPIDIYHPELDTADVILGPTSKELFIILGALRLNEGDWIQLMRHIDGKTFVLGGVWFTPVLTENSPIVFNESLASILFRFSKLASSLKLSIPELLDQIEYLFGKEVTLWNLDKIRILIDAQETLAELPLDKKSVKAILKGNIDSYKIGTSYDNLPSILEQSAPNFEKSFVRLEDFESIRLTQQQFEKSIIEAGGKLFPLIDFKHILTSLFTTFVTNEYLLAIPYKSSSKKKKNKYTRINSTLLVNRDRNTIIKNAVKYLNLSNNPEFKKAIEELSDEKQEEAIKLFDGVLKKYYSDNWIFIVNTIFNREYVVFLFLSQILGIGIGRIKTLSMLTPLRLGLLQSGVKFKEYSQALLDPEIAGREEKILGLLSEFATLNAFFDVFELSDDELSNVLSKRETLGFEEDKKNNTWKGIKLDQIKRLNNYKKLKHLLSFNIESKGYDLSKSAIEEHHPDLSETQIESLLKEVADIVNPLDKVAKAAQFIQKIEPLGLSIGDLKDIISEGYNEIKRSNQLLLSVFKSKYSSLEAWEEAYAPYREQLLEKKRDALVDYILSWRNDPSHRNNRYYNFRDQNDLFHYFLIDTKISGCGRISKIKAAHLSLQLYVHRVQMNLEISTDRDFLTFLDPDEARQWLWRKNYRVWEANRKVFLYPENYLEPELRDDKTALFKELEDELFQQESVNENSEDIYRKYLTGLEKLARLKIAGAFYHRLTKSYYIFGRSNSRPFTYYYTYFNPYIYNERGESWGSWKKINLPINTARLSGFLDHRDRLRVFWVEIKTLPIQPEVPQNIPRYEHKKTVKINLAKQDFEGKFILSYEYTLENPYELHKSYETILIDSNYMEQQIHTISDNSLVFIPFSSNNDETNIFFAERNKLLKKFNFSLKDDQFKSLSISGSEWRGISDLVNNSPNNLATLSMGSKFLQYPKPAGSLTDKEVVPLWSDSTINMISYLNQSDFNQIFSEESQKILFSQRYYLITEIYSRKRYPGVLGDFNNELFFHIPFLVGNHFNANQKYKEAKWWYERIFSPADSDINNYDMIWKFHPFRSFRFPGQNKTIPLLKDLITDVESIGKYEEEPFNPHAIARSRPTAYMKAVIMKYIDNLLDWGDSLFAKDTFESINEAMMLYILAQDILGDRPVSLGSCEVKNETIKYRDIEEGLSEGNEDDIYLEYYITTYKAYQDSNYNDFDIAQSNIFERDSYISDRLKHENYQPFIYQQPTLNLITQKIYQPVFCIPPNQTLLGYWNKVEDRLYKIRNCMNLSGIKRSLSLFEPPIDPALLVAATSSGLSVEEAVSILTNNKEIPRYRFNIMLSKAREFAGTVQSLGNSLLSAIQNKDNEELTLLRSNHEQNILKLTKQIKERQIEEVKAQKQNLVENKENVQNRIDHFKKLIEVGLIPQEKREQKLRKNAGTWDNIASGLRSGASLARILPQTEISIPLSVEWGGVQIGSAMEAVAGSFSLVGNIKNRNAIELSVQAGNFRRDQEWKQQVKLAEQELIAIEEQLKAAQKRIEINEHDLGIFNKQVEQTKELHDFYKSKLTKFGLFNYHATSLSRLYRQAYNRALQMAKEAERCFQFEVDAQDTFIIQNNNWDTTHYGFLAAENLIQQLQELEKAYLEKNERRQEITQSFSLRQLSPQSLWQLKSDGNCEFTLPSWAFDLFYPGQYRRLIKSVRITIPCVTGPYNNVGAVLSLNESQVRVEANSDLAGRPYGKGDFISTSNALNDGGLFELNFRDERYLPFEGAGAEESKWSLELPEAFKSFDYNTISDVVIHVSYTAKFDGGIRKQTAIDDLNEKFGKLETLGRFFSLRHDFPNEYNFLKKGNKEEVSIKIDQSFFPYFVAGKSLSLSKAGAAIPGHDAWNINNNDMDDEGKWEITISKGIFSENPDGYFVLGYQVVG